MGAAVASFHLENWEESLSLLNELVVNYPYGEFIEEAEVMRMEALVREGKYEEAQRSFQQFLVRFPQSPFWSELSFGMLPVFIRLKTGKCSKIPGRIPPPLSPEFLSLFYHRDAGLYLSKSGERREAQKYFSQLEGEEGDFLTADAYYREKIEEAISSFEDYLSVILKVSFL